MTRFGEAVYAWMKREKKRSATSDEVWAALAEIDPALTTKSETRKTPRTTMMRDLRKDTRFTVSKGLIERLERESQ